MSNPLIDKLKKSKLIKESLYNPNKPINFISTECKTLDILFSGRMTGGGIPKGKVSSIAAPSGLGKTFIGLKVAKQAQKQYGMDVLYIDTEHAYDPNFADAIGVDSNKFIPIQNHQIEEVQQIIVSSISELDRNEKDNLILIIDSWGGLVTSKTINDAMAGKDVTDMTIAKKKNSLARIINGLNLTSFVISQTYSTMDQYKPLAIGGGSGLIFASSSIVLSSSKAKSKDGTEVNGTIITASTYKGRFAVENSKLKYMIRYEGGIHPYYGLLDLALEYGIITKPSMGWYSRSVVEDDKKWREKEIWADETTKEFWTPIINDKDFNYYVEKNFSFSHNTIYSIDNEDQIVDTETGEILDNTEMEMEDNDNDE